MIPPPLFRPAALIALAGALAVPCAEPAGAQAVDFYRTTNLGVPNPNWDLKNTIIEARGINQSGQVVGWVTDGVTNYAFVWLPEPAYGLAAQTMHLLGPGTVYSHAAAWDINDDGVVVGHVHDGSPDARRAAIWELAPPMGYTQPAHLLGDEDEYQVREAYGVNNVSPDYQVVGFYFHFPPPNPPPTVPPRAYIWIHGTDPVAVTELPPTNELGGPAWNASEAYDVSTGVPLVVGGWSGNTLYQCATASGDASAWNLAGHALAQPPGFGSGDEIYGQARGVNQANRLVGNGHQEVSPFICRDRGLDWLNLGAVPFNLHALPGVIPNHATIAEATNNTSPRYVVGFNAQINLAARWKNEAGTWTFKYLHDLTCNNTSCNTCSWQLWRALDINDDTGGWIAGWGKTGPFLDLKRGFVLIPLGPCPWDIDGDGNVGSSDLSALVTAWGFCPSDGHICWADVNGDCLVNSADLSALILNWGPCPGGSGQGIQPPPSAAELVVLLGDNPEALVAALLSLAELEAAQESQDN